MPKCPVEGCGRQFDNQLTMIQHVKRRHPIQADLIKQKTNAEMIEKEHKMTEELNKLPKMNRIIQMSKEKKPLEFQRRSTSKKRKQEQGFTSMQGSFNQTSSIINQSRQMLQQQQTKSKKLLNRRPSLTKKSSISTQQHYKLPTLEINNLKTKKLKLQSLKSSQIHDKSLNLQQNYKEKTQPQKAGSKLKMKTIESGHDLLATTAPNFYQRDNKQQEVIEKTKVLGLEGANKIEKKLSNKIQALRSRSKGKDGELSNRSVEKKNIRKVGLKQEINGQNGQKKTLGSKNVDNLILKEKQKISQQLLGSRQIKSSHRPLKRPLQKRISHINNNKQCQISRQTLSESVYIESETSKQNSNQINQQQRNNKIFNKMKKSLSIGQKKKQQLDDQIWLEKTVSIHNKNLYELILPDNCQIQYLFLHHCKLSNLNLNQCYSLVQLSLIHNQLNDVAFLQPNIDGTDFQNLEALYLDHNLITSLADLPTNLEIKKLSLAFNRLKNLKELLKVLRKLSFLEELDLSFNPVRKEPNYKLAVIALCKELKVLDGMKVTKFDREMAQEYYQSYHQYFQEDEDEQQDQLEENNNNFLQNSRNYPQGFQNQISPNNSPSDSKFRPSTAVSITYQNQSILPLNQPQKMTSLDMTPQELQKQINYYQKLVKNIKEQYEIIQEENNTLEEEIDRQEQTLQQQIKNESKDKNNIQNTEKLYKKLSKQLEELELLNYLQFCSQKELQDILLKKVKDNGYGEELLAGLF